MDREPTNRRLLMGLVVGAVAAWGAFLALGSYLGLDPATPDRDLRRMLMVGGCVAAFLGVWMWLLWRRGPR
jgi:hypothetical protein